MAKISAPQNVREAIGNHMLADGMDPIVDLEKSHGSWVVDARDGKEYLDLFSMFASMSVGYNHPYVLDHKEYLATAALNKPTNSDIYSTQMADFVTTMAHVAQPEYLPYAFYIEGGALAVENALKTAFDWKSKLNRINGKSTLGSKVIHFEQCFHGRSGYTLSLTDSHDKRKTNYFPKFDWPRISNPHIDFPLSNESNATIEAKEVKALDEIKSVLKESADEVACLIIEPIQGEGGDNHYRPDFFKSLKTLANENDFLLIYDEVQTGIAITGKMWCHQHFGDDAQPDIISFGKKTQVCGIFAGKRLDRIDDHVFKESSRLNSTWGGNLTDMVRFKLYLDIIENENLVQNAHELGNFLQAKLEVLENTHTDKISGSRGIGLFRAFDCNSSEDRDKLTGLIQTEGAIVLGSGEKTIRFRPHLNISSEEIDQGIDMISRALGKL